MQVAAPATRLVALVAALLAFPSLAMTPPSGQAKAVPKAADARPKAYNIAGALALGDNSGYQFATVTGPVRLDVGTITNESATNTSGSVRVALFLTPEPSPSNVLYTIAQVDLNATLPPGFHFNAQSFTVPFTPPPDGIYYVHMGVLEYEPTTCTAASGYCLDDYLTFENRVQVTGGQIFDAGPPPIAGNAVAIEYYHAGLDHYFLTASAAEAAFVDNGGAGAGWARTGQQFVVGTVAAQPNVLAVCRFYGSLDPGPNSHFYTVDRAECEGLIALQATTPAYLPRWNYEGVAFAASVPVGGLCTNPNYPVPVHRLYNNGFASGRDSNHRYTSQPAIVTQMVGRGWRHEGVVYCVIQ